jgi:NAD(P)-dependent dehydrogenase (short-subunit alcohol dehydrogenase family)
MQRMQSVMITGGGSGIGRAATLRLARAGVAVVVIGRRAHALEETAGLARRVEPTACVRTMVADVSLPHELERAWHQAEQELGRIDGLVTAAAAYEPKPIETFTLTEWDATLNTVLRGTFLAAHLASAHMTAHGGGRLVFLSSISGVISEPGSAAYNASKAGVTSLARSLAVDLTRVGIVVNAVAPGWVRTPMTEQFLESAPADAFDRVALIRRATEPDEVANLIEYLLIHAPPALTGTTIYIDGGQTAMAQMP